MSEDLSKQIVIEKQSFTGLKQALIQVIITFIIGILLGILSKYCDTVPENELYGFIFRGISNITTRLGIWVMLATIISIYSKNKKIAAVKVFFFFIGMLSAYYIYTRLLFGFFPMYYIIRWGIIGLASPLLACIIWFAKGSGWSSSIIASFPVGLLLQQGFAFGLDYCYLKYFPELIMACILLMLLYKNPKQILIIISLSIIEMNIIQHLNIISYFFGGL